MNATCSLCGHALKHRARFCTRCGTPASGGKTCPTCGIANDADDNFCYACGDSLVHERPYVPPPTTPPPGSSSGPRVRWLVLGILLGALLSGGGALGWWLFDR